MIYSTRDAVKNKVFPHSMHTLRKLIKNGELHKKGLYAGDDFIYGINTASEGCTQARWSVESDEINKWLLRKARRK